MRMMLCFSLGNDPLIYYRLQQKLKQQFNCIESFAEDNHRSRTIVVMQYEDVKITQQVLHCCRSVGVDVNCYELKEYEMEPEVKEYDGYILHRIAPDSGWVDNISIIEPGCSIGPRCHVYGGSTIGKGANIMGGSIIKGSKVDATVCNSKITGSNIVSGRVYSSTVDTVFSSDAGIVNSTVTNCTVIDSRIEDSLCENSLIDRASLIATTIRDQTDYLVIRGFEFPVTIMRRTDTMAIGCHIQPISRWYEMLANGELSGLAKEEGVKNLDYMAKVIIGVLDIVRLTEIEEPPAFRSVANV